MRVQADDFCKLIELLTGKPVKRCSPVDEAHIGSAVQDDEKKLGYSQFNELLLLANKDRLREPFFSHFFCTGEDFTSKIQDLRQGVGRFRKAAMLRFGNFIYAYRRLSRLPTSDALLGELGEFAKTEKELLAQFRERQSATLIPEIIPREETHYVGYLTAAEAAGDLKRVELLERALGAANWEEARTTLAEIADEGIRTEMMGLFERLREKSPSKEVAEGIVRSALEVIRPTAQKVKETQEKAKRNSDIYLTWDCMDVYFATSMRKCSEYEDLFDLVKNLLGHRDLSDLVPHLRYFDPTQSFEADRIDKGLVEALMLKRARCTVYSVQDVDTLGKDSELAATLAQGKAVIAYAPRVDVESEAVRLAKERPASLKRWLYFVLHADEGMSSRLEEKDKALLASFPAKLDEFELSLPLPCKSWVSPDALVEFQRANGEDLQRFCRIIAEVLARIYDKRAETLLRTHPLGLQVNLKTGVANGVLVARDIPTCAALLRGVLLNSLDLAVEQNEKEGYWVLKERRTGSVYRVVTGNQKLTNCFWNFYEERTSGE